ncbi:MAG: M14 metallopeptidase family protein [Pyrinomonadaceae bacterium]
MKTRLFFPASSLFASLRLCGIFLFLFLPTAAQTAIPAPKDTLGFTPGDDRKLASWAQIVDYFKKLDAASDRVMFEEIGKTTMGAPFVYATISSPENLDDLGRYKEINDNLADPRLFNRKRGAPETYAQRFIRDGKTIVLITCGIHSTEVGSTLSSMLIAHRLASSNEPEIKKILDNTIVLLVPSLNPDGVDIVKNWYDKTLGTPFEGTEPPELYHKYVGHDNNRDWYAFTQVETQLTVDKIHNVWHPQIVHDIHQQGQNGSRLFLPPYMQPVEPNVPKQIVEGYTELGNYMAADLRKQGLAGITTNSTYDAWTPARAYSHYHGGVRILSETASARLATPVNIKFENLRVPADDGYDPKVESANFGPVWRGGEWRLRDITNYMTTAAFSLLNHAADNREKWLSRFYEIGKEAVRPRKAGELHSIIVNEPENLQWFTLRGSLYKAGVTFDQAGEFTYKGVKYPNGTTIIRMDQPYAAFAKALLEDQHYPDLKDANGAPIPPYDVTAHSLNRLMDVKTVPVYEPIRFPPQKPFMYSPAANPPAPPPAKRTIRLYRSETPSMDEGWTRWVFENYNRLADSGPTMSFKYSSIRNGEISALRGDARSYIVFPDQSPNQILNGYAKGSMPDEYTGGVGKEGVENLKKFVEAGGTLVFLNRSSDFAIEQFNLPVRDVTKGLARKDFYIPGSILRTELDTAHPIAKGMPKESIAWFENGPAFELYSGWASTGSGPPTPWQLIKRDDIRIIARYPSDPKQILLSGWALGAEKIAGKAALVEVKVGKGRIILFGFRPQYRGQSLATFPLLFNAISN